MFFSFHLSISCFSLAAVTDTQERQLKEGNSLFTLMVSESLMHHLTPWMEHRGRGSTWQKLSLLLRGTEGKVIRVQGKI